MRFRSLIVPAVLAVAALIPASSVAGPAPVTSVQIAAQAQLNTTASIVVTVTVQCSPFVGFGGEVFNTTSVFVNVSQTGTATPGFGGGTSIALCDNQKHPVAVEVTGGPFNLGKASAAAAAAGFTFTQDARVITIVS
jgi:hypothetical protein